MSSNSFVKLCSPTSGLNQLPPYSQLPLFPDWDRERLRLSLDEPKSFFLYAGAGSGKTRALVTVLERLRKNSRRRLCLGGRSVGVITYTNAARDEISRRLDSDPLISVSTIHAFAWELIGSHNYDIREWLRTNLSKEIAEIREAQKKGKSGQTKAARERDAKLKSMSRRLNRLSGIRKFIYSPTGDNRGRDALNHSEVISIAASFLRKKPILQRVLVSKFPILLIDESQDTVEELMNSLLEVQRIHHKHFTLGLLGDTMQRIYGHGKADLGVGLPDNWARPAKAVNYRCPKRVVQLINSVRKQADGQKQTSPPGKCDGVVRLFVLSSEASNKSEIEAKVAAHMSDVADDSEWNSNRKTLTLEHRMAAHRMGFEELYAPLHAVEKNRTGLLDGTLSALKFFTSNVLPLVQALRGSDRFGVARVLRKLSPLLSVEALKATGTEQRVCLTRAKDASDKLAKLWDNRTEPTLLEVLCCIENSNLLEIPPIFDSILDRSSLESPEDEDDDEDNRDPEVAAWDKVMQVPFSQVSEYRKYVMGESLFDTHQGVKGLEFPRIMLIIDDDDAKGFLFSYEKLFGAKAKTKTDEKNEEEGKETSIDRTRRLFYVTCSRAESSLAVVAYSKDPDAVRNHAVESRWFEDGEIEIWNGSASPV